MSSTHINQLQILKQNLEALLLQKQQLESQRTELDSALTELGRTSSAYKIVGKVMVASSPGELKEDLEQKKKVIDLRIANVKKQEEKLKKSMEDIQKKAVKELQEKKKNG